MEATLTAVTTCGCVIAFLSVLISAWAPGRGHRVARVLLLVAASAIWSHGAAAAADGQASASERAVKAAYLYKFLAYVDWPATAFTEPDTPFVIGVVHAEDIAAELAPVVAHRSVNGRSIQVRVLRDNEGPAGVHMLFIGRMDRARVTQSALAAQQQARPILIVTESPGALDAGSMINLVLSDGRVRFEVSLENAEHVGLKLSSRLLAVAQQVRPAPP